MAKGYSARRGFSNGSGQMLKQQQMQQQIMKMQEDMQKAQQEVEEKTFSASVGGGVVSAEVNGKKEVTNITLESARAYNQRFFESTAHLWNAYI